MLEKLTQRNEMNKRKCGAHLSNPIDVRRRYLNSKEHSNNYADVRRNTLLEVRGKKAETYD